MSIDSQDQYIRPRRGLLHRLINILFVIGLVILAYFAYQYFFSNSSNDNEDPKSSTKQEETDIKPLEVKTIEIKKSPIPKTNFQKVGTVTPYKFAVLTSQTTGILKDFKVEEGDSVLKNENLVSISDSVSTEIAQINYDNALKNLENAKKSYKSTNDSVQKDADIATIGIQSAKLNYDNAVKSYENLQKSIEEQTRSAEIGLQSKQLALQAAQENYFNTDTTSNISFNNILDQSLSGITPALSLIDSSTDLVNNLIATKSVWGKDLKFLELDNLQNDSDDIFNRYRDLKNEYNNIQGDRNSDSTRNLISSTLKLVEDAKYILQDVKDIIDKADSNETLITLNTSTNALLASLAQSENGLYASNQTLESALINRQLQPEGTMTKIEMAQEQVTAAIQQLNQLKQTGKAQLDNATHAIDIAKKQVDSATEQHSNIIAKGSLQKIGADNQVSAVEGQVAIAKTNLESATLKAPFDGTVLEKFLDEGNYVNPSQKVLSIGDLKKVYITVNLTTEELSFVKLGQEVEINAPGGIEEKGKITKVIPTVDPISKKIHIKILIPNKGGNFISGMFTDVIFKNAKTSTASKILIPFNSVLFEQNDAYVYIIKDDKALKTKITLGNPSGTEIEVKDGLSQGDIIITDGAKTVKDGDNVNTNA
ncbi:efflux RND transporter periplasmic adaptor subunit [bacterium]|nr:efflux RND transporter periplasmic adaptor subunit [bacterium]